MLSDPTDLLDRLPHRVLDRIVVRGAHWLWVGHCRANGHGRTWWRGSMVQVSRLIYTAAEGMIPAGRDVVHLCRRPECVRPQHLALISTHKRPRRWPRLIAAA